MLVTLLTSLINKSSNIVKTFIKLLFIFSISATLIYSYFANIQLTDSVRSKTVIFTRFVHQVTVFLSYANIILRKKKLQKLKILLNMADDQFADQGFYKEVAVANALVKQQCWRYITFQLFASVLALVCFTVTVSFTIGVRVMLVLTVFGLSNAYSWTWIKLCSSRLNILNCFMRRTKIRRQTKDEFCNAVLIVEILSDITWKITKEVNLVCHLFLLTCFAFNYIIAITNTYLALPMKKNLLVVLAVTLRNVFDLGIIIGACEDILESVSIFINSLSFIFLFSLVVEFCPKTNIFLNSSNFSIHFLIYYLFYLLIIIHEFL